MFSADQILFIQNLIDTRIETRLKPKVASRDFHGYVEIRHAILDRLDEFKQWVGSETFTTQLLAHFLAARLVLTERDMQPSEKRGGNVKLNTRFYDNLSKCLRGWKQSPFEDTGSRGQYRFKDCQHRAQLELTPAA